MSDRVWRARDEHERARVVVIAERIVASQVEKGEVNPDDPAALRAAVREAVMVAGTAYRAAEEFLAG